MFLNRDKKQDESEEFNETYEEFVADLRASGVKGLAGQGTEPEIPRGSAAGAWPGAPSSPESEQTDGMPDFSAGYPSFTTEAPSSAPSATPTSPAEPHASAPSYREPYGYQPEAPAPTPVAAPSPAPAPSYPQAAPKKPAAPSATPSSNAYEGAPQYFVGMPVDPSSVSPEAAAAAWPGATTAMPAVGMPVGAATVAASMPAPPTSAATASAMPQMPATPRAPYDFGQPQAQPGAREPDKAKKGFSLFSKKEKKPREKKAKSLKSPLEKRAAKQRSDARRLTTLCGALAAVSVFAIGFSAVTFMSGQEMIGRATANLKSVVTVTQNVAVGSTITEDMLAVTQVPSEFVPEDAADEIDQVAGHKALSALTAGIPVSLTTIQASEEPANMASAVRDGYVAKMYALDGSAGMSPFLSPGDYVTCTYTKDTSGTSENVVLKHVRIIAVGSQLTGTGAEGYSSLTFELTQEQVEDISHATSFYVTIEPRSEWPDFGKTGGEEETGAQDANKDGNAGDTQAEGGKDSMNAAGDAKDGSAASDTGSADTGRGGTVITVDPASGNTPVAEKEA